MYTRCPYCGSTRIFVDEVHGAIVCMECGSVIEEGLVDETGGVYRKHEEHAIATNVNRVKPATIDVNSVVLSVKRREARELVKRIARREKSRREAEQIVTRLRCEYSVATLEELNRIVKLLEEAGVASRVGARTKLALAEIVLRMLRGVYPPIPEIARKYCVSVATLRRLVKRVEHEKIVDKILVAVRR